MRPEWALAHPQLFSDEGEIRTPTPAGHDVLSVACLPVPPHRRMSDPDGNRTRVGQVEGLAVRTNITPSRKQASDTDGN